MDGNDIGKRNIEPERRQFLVRFFRVIDEGPDNPKSAGFSNAIYGAW